VSTSVSNEKSPTVSRGTSTSGTKLRTWVVVISTLALSMLIFFIVYTQGHVSGREFSPTHFQSREFSFYEIPLLHIQITPIRRKSTSLPTATYVRQNGLVSAPRGTPDTWHLVYLSRGLSGTTPADAQLLVDQLEMYGEKGAFWKKWSIDHPEHAAEIWPIAQRLAERELYVLIPMVMELAQKDLSVEKMTGQVNELLKRQYRLLVTDMRAADRGELAQTLLEEATNDYPNDPELKKLRVAEPTPTAVPTQNTE
jgi:hypothetical protein